MYVVPLVIDYPSLLSAPFLVIIVGAFCTAWGIFIIFYLPNTIAGCRFISRDERMFMVARLRKNQTGIETKAGIKMDQLRVCHSISRPSAPG